MAITEMSLFLQESGAGQFGAITEAAASNDARARLADILGGARRIRSAHMRDPLPHSCA
ncbi:MULTISPECIES: hypothetical protein [unclassified Paracoccus (in: a-proteobacteria)]|uniref:hypothetical protein n=1 Tax=unclassified Paracoccus (in: a-proteobacteria) TaxID=2688777 RepID=UPI0012B42AEE|nr:MULTISPECIES: hypothetical protein [unclassified Paracoccus (in: a-proteobacteria)]UXU76038.1 hypothetical protein GB879_006040 [Paracoccus sp. SMMA_5]UXU81948.1 hypothetical protein GB880_006025 [Paracoccus sp. SMMA_5_TC]